MPNKQRVELLTLDRKLIDVLYEGTDAHEAAKVAVRTIRESGGLLVDSRSEEGSTTLELLKGNDR